VPPEATELVEPPDPTVPPEAPELDEPPDPTVPAEATELVEPPELSVRPEPPAPVLAPPLSPELGPPRLGSSFEQFVVSSERMPTAASRAKRFIFASEDRLAIACTGAVARLARKESFLARGFVR
jgi:hypothetical protein